MGHTVTYCSFHNNVSLLVEGGCKGGGQIQVEEKRSGTAIHDVGYIKPMKSQNRTISVLKSAKTTTVT